MNEQQSSYVVCIDNSTYPESLELKKIYRRLPDASAEVDGFIRVIDESGEAYLFPSRLFVHIQVPEAVEKVFAAA